MARSRKIVTVELVGGIGNQLFQYAAGRYLANKTSSSLRVITSAVELNVSGHKSDIRSLRLVAKNEYRRFAWIRKYFWLLNSRMSTRISLWKSIYSRITHEYLEDEVGYSRNLEDLGPPILIRGYFQSWRYLDGGFRKLQLSKESRSFKEKMHDIESVKPIAVHIRRGDYTKLNNTFGILSESYYLEGIKTLQSKLGNRPVYVFSDDLSFVKNMFKNQKFEIRFIENSINPAEDLILMSNVKGIVISNSTFSWWAAYSNVSKSVIAPDPWFKTLPEPIDLIPPLWNRQKSTWEK
jgi:hypothetical protein